MLAAPRGYHWRWPPFFQFNSRIQLAPHARRRAVPMTVSEWVPVVCANDEVAKDRRTGITRAYTEYSGYAFSGENHGLHNALLTRRLYNLLGAGHDLEARLFFAEWENMQRRGSSDSRATADSHCDTQGSRNEVKCHGNASAEMSFNLGK